MDSEWTLSGLESSTVQPLLERLSSGTHLREKSSRTFQETAIAVLERSHIHNEPTYDKYNHAHRYAHRVGPRTAATSPCSALSRRMMDGRRLISPQSTQMEDRYDTVSCKSMNEEISDDCAVNDPQTSRPTREREIGGTGSHAVFLVVQYQPATFTLLYSLHLVRHIVDSIVQNAGYDVVSSRAAHHRGSHNCPRTIFSWAGRSSGTSLF